MANDQSMSLTEAARRLGVSTAWLRRWVEEGLIQSHTGGGRPRFTVDEIDRARAALGFAGPTARGN